MSALLFQVIEAIYCVRDAVFWCWENGQPAAARPAGQPTLVAPAPVITPFPFPPAFVAAPLAPSPPPPSPVQVGQSRGIRLPPKMGLLLAVVLPLAAGCFLCLLVAVWGRAHAEQPKQADPNAWVPGEHQAVLKRLAGKLSDEGFVWHNGKNEDLKLAGNEAALLGQGEILNHAFPFWKWSLRREGLPAISGGPQIWLWGGSREEQLPTMFPHQGLNELKRVKAELPAGSLETFVRLATYAEELYEEDHGGRLIAPGLGRGDARVDVRRKLAPRQ